MLDVLLQTESTHAHQRQHGARDTPMSLLPALTSLFADALVNGPCTSQPEQPALPPSPQASAELCVHAKHVGVMDALRVGRLSPSSPQVAVAMKMVLQEPHSYVTIGVARVMVFVVPEGSGRSERGMRNRRGRLCRRCLCDERDGGEARRDRWSLCGGSCCGEEGDTVKEEEAVYRGVGISGDDGVARELCVCVVRRPAYWMSN